MVKIGTAILAAACCAFAVGAALHLAPPIIDGAASSEPAVYRETGLLPNPALTPGDIMTTDTATVCTAGYAASVRDVPYNEYRAVYREYGIVGYQPGKFELDHLVPLELGGSNEIANLWPQPRHGSAWNAVAKDALENRLHDLVCHGALPLETAQMAIARDWIAAYREYVQ